MNRELVFVHGRAQQNKDPTTLKAEWLDALNEGLAKSALRLTTPATSVRFPFYGDTLRDLSEGVASADAAEIVVRGVANDEDQRRFTLEVIQDLIAHAGISEAQIENEIPADIVERGPLNWAWVQAGLRAIDRFVPHGSGSAIALFTHDVYAYLTDSAIRQRIEDGVRSAITPGVETIVVAHSLGTVVAYNLLRREGHLRGWSVPQLVTVGAPLAVEAIRRELKSFAPIQCPPCVSNWFNARDERDVVALYPLDPKCFPLDPPAPAIENKNDVRNLTENRHGIAGYLSDAVVAKRIYDAINS